MTENQSRPIADAQATDYSIQEIRVMKARGFYGVTVPVHFYIFTPQSGVIFATYGSYPHECTFFVADRPYQIIEISGRCQGLGSGLFAMGVTKMPSGTITGDPVMTGALNFGSTGTANAVTRITRGTATNFINSNSTSVLAAGDSLRGAVIDGTPAGCINICISVLLRSI